MIDSFVTSAELAKLIGVSQRRIQQLESEGILIKNPDNKFELSKNIQLFYMWKLRPAENADYMKEHALLEKAKREKAEIELAKLQNRIHDADDIEEVLTGMLITFRTRILALPSKVAPLIIGQKNIGVITDVLRKELKTVLIELSEYDPEMFTKGEFDEE